MTVKTFKTIILIYQHKDTKNFFSIKFSFNKKYTYNRRKKTFFHKFKAFFKKSLA